MNSLSSLLARPGVNHFTKTSPIEGPAPLLMVGEQKKSGLILCKEFHAEFVGPGAALCSPVEQPYKAVIAIGSPDIMATSNTMDRSRAYGLRIQWSRWLYRIADQDNPIDRVEKLLAGLEGFFGRSVVMSLPIEVLALLVGVFPHTVEQVKENYHDGNMLIFPCDQLKVTTLCLDYPNAFRPNDVPLKQQTTLKEIQRTYSGMLRSA
ncbi:MAG: hypothetical protein LH631_06500 [Alkalinema sp. CAN_BIN05]|nr:hypothetical protein [Alkalinema sp. CAN_BIN05]